MTAATKLPTGRALDALIAEKVFGAMLHEGQHEDYMTLPGERPVSDQRRVPDYSTDIASAWEVVEKLQGFDKRRAEPWWSVAVFYGQPGQVGCRVYSCPPGYSIFDAGNVDAWEARQEPRIIAHVVADTAPLAICRAALDALESGAA